MKQEFLLTLSANILDKKNVEYTIKTTGNTINDDFLLPIVDVLVALNNTK